MPPTHGPSPQRTAGRTTNQHNMKPDELRS